MGKNRKKRNESTHSERFNSGSAPLTDAQRGIVPGSRWTSRFKPSPSHSEYIEEDVVVLETAFQTGEELVRVRNTGGDIFYLGESAFIEKW